MSDKNIVSKHKVSNVGSIDLDGFDLLPGWQPTPGKIYTTTRAISSRVNQNFDAWPSSELKKAYKTFLGKPVFVNHVNDDPTKARGVVVACRFVEDGKDKYIEVIQEVDAEKFPLLAKELIEGGLDSVSMGCEARRSVCSICGNESSNVFDMCDHVLNYKGTKINGKLVYETCYDLGFFELSYVFDPADETALISKVVTASDEFSEEISEEEKQELDNIDDFYTIYRYIDNYYPLNPEIVSESFCFSPRGDGITFQVALVNRDIVISDHEGNQFLVPEKLPFEKKLEYITFKFPKLHEERYGW